MPSATLLPEEKSIIRQAIGHECQIYTATVCRLYEAANQKWHYLGTGAMAFMKDTRRRDSFFMRFVDLKAGRVIWEQELYNGFQYSQDRPFFHTFSTDDAVCGLSFADEREALSFYTKVINRENLRLAQRNPSVPKKSTASAAPGNSISQAAPDVSGSGTMFSKKKKKGSGAPKIDKSAIGAPTNFRHLTHIGWDPAKGFSTMNIPPEWKKVFEQAGVTEEQLKDQSTAQFIFDFMASQGVPAQETNTSATLPRRSSENVQQSAIMTPMVPEVASPTRPVSTAQGGRRAPPPPPPSRPGRGRAPPPPGRTPPPPSRMPPPPADQPAPPPPTTIRVKQGPKIEYGSQPPTNDRPMPVARVSSMDNLDTAPPVTRPQPPEQPKRSPAPPIPPPSRGTPKEPSLVSSPQEPPPLPSRDQRSPSVSNENIVEEDFAPPVAPPPPPPLPSLDTAPPPPPIPKQSSPQAKGSLPPVRVDLMESIRAAGTSSLKHVDTEQKSHKKSDSKADLMQSIRDAKNKNLRPVSQNPVKPSQSLPPPSSDNDVASALKNALRLRQAVMVINSDDEENVEDDDDW